MPVTPCSSCGRIPSFKSLEEGLSEYSCPMSEPTCIALKGRNPMMLAYRWERMNNPSEAGTTIISENEELLRL